MSRWSLIDCMCVFCSVHWRLLSLDELLLSSLDLMRVLQHELDRRCCFERMSDLSIIMEQKQKQMRHHEMSCKMSLAMGIDYSDITSNVTTLKFRTFIFRWNFHFKWAVFGKTSPAGVIVMQISQLQGLHMLFILKTYCGSPLWSRRTTVKETENDGRFERCYCSFQTLIFLHVSLICSFTTGIFFRPGLPSPVSAPWRSRFSAGDEHKTLFPLVSSFSPFVPGILS